MSIYIETRIRAPLEDVWRATQTPDLHERWDARFTRIEYLPRESGSTPQRFRYTTRIGFGIEVSGEGETTHGAPSSRGARASSLRFWSKHPLSLIRAGSGFWKYEPDGSGVRFYTEYDYTTRFGPFGRAMDRVFFRPLMSWATAWSFDRLRIWLERGVDPRSAIERFVECSVARLTLGFTWLYQGLVPKLVAPHADELGMLADGGLAPGASAAALTALGIAEALLGAILLGFPRLRWPLLLSLIAMVPATLCVALRSPRFLAAPFNPVTLNALVAAVSMIGLIASRDLPSASRCLRKARRENA